MATIYTQIDKNTRRTWLMMGLFFILIILIGWVFSQVYGNPVILYGAVIFSIAMNFASYWYSDKLVLAISRAKPIEKKDAPELYRIVENLTITAGLPMPKIYILEERALNAFATGRDAKHAVVAVTRGLLERLDKNELEGVLAHELSHIGNRDMLVSTVAVVLVGFIAMLSDFFLRFTFFSSHRRDNEGKGGNVLMLIGVALAILAPLIASLMRLAISRRREFLADASGVLLTRYPEGLINALKKISSDPAQLSVANHATAHLFIANPFKARDGVDFLTKIFMTHPPIKERIQALERVKF
ncbi:MAG: M48 family metallopeptidase [Candidatus Sungiibacteriota bacterium]